MPEALQSSGKNPDRRIISISAKRQITIPQKFYTLLGFTDEAECVLQNGELIIRPPKKSDDAAFSEYLLEKLISEGYNGEELLTEFKRMQKGVRPAVEAMISEAEKAADGDGEFYTEEEIFGEEDKP